MKTKELIELLKKCDKDGNCNVYIASDSECNSLSTMDKTYSVDFDFNANNGSKFIVLTPFEEGLDYEELE